MRIGYKASYLFEPRKSGIHVYLVNLLRAMADLGEVDIRLYASGVGRELEPEARELLGRASGARLSRVQRGWDRAMMPLYALVDGIDVMHVPSPFVPTWFPKPLVATVHDLAPFRMPDMYESEREAYAKLTREVIQAPDVLVAVSESTKRDVVEFFDMPEDRIVVSPLGVNGRFRPVEAPEERVAERFDLHQPYMMAVVGSAHPRKNLAGVVRIFDRLDRDDLDLVIVGSCERDAEATRAIAESPQRERIRVLGHLPEEDLPLVYSGARLLCFPTYYEGWGLPVLEALACGTPVVCADNSSLPEAGGDAAVLLQADDLDAFVHAVGRLIDDQAHWEERRARGLAHAADFTWRRTARCTLDAYRRARDM